MKLRNMPYPMINKYQSVRVYETDCTKVTHFG